jgi:hypothetical protein
MSEPLYRHDMDRHLLASDEEHERRSAGDDDIEEGDDFEPETETIEMRLKWESSLWVDVPKGWRPGPNLGDFPQSVLEQMTSETAELVDWE